MLSTDLLLRIALCLGAAVYLIAYQKTVRLSLKDLKSRATSVMVAVSSAYAGYLVFFPPHQPAISFFGVLCAVQMGFYSLYAMK